MSASGAAGAVAETPGSGEETPDRGRTPGLDAVLERLVAEPWTFGLFQAVRLLERTSPERSTLAAFGDPRKEAVRLSQNPSLSFPASEIQELAPGAEGGPPRLQANVRGLVGAMGVLPHPYSVLVLERRRERDRTLQDFLDIFHHRFLSLLYAAWRKNRPELAPERGDTDELLRHLLDLAGMGHEQAEVLRGLGPDTVGWYMGVLAPPARSAAGLEQLLSDRFDTRVEVESFVGGWLPLDEADLCRLGEEGDGDVLGGAVVGDEVWDPHARIRIRMGPLGRGAYDRLLPGGPDHEPVRRLVRFYTHDQFQAELQLVLSRDEVSPTVLGGGEGPPVALGWATWLRTRPRDTDADETTLTL